MVGVRVGGVVDVGGFVRLGVWFVSVWDSWLVCVWGWQGVTGWGGGGLDTGCTLMPRSEIGVSDPVCQATGEPLESVNEIDLSTGWAYCLGVDAVRERVLPVAVVTGAHGGAGLLEVAVVAGVLVDRATGLEVDPLAVVAVIGLDDDG